MTKFPPNFVFSIIGYLMKVSEITHHKEVKKMKSEKNLKYTYPRKRYSVLKFEFPAILCYF